ncbi:hypothetical protein JZO77_23260 [Enterococcus hulanensis]|uniref:hypothetical protein n=1 Tax=Enterococcus hulanensis TaxID=2559929 RepID=UPI001A8C4539|nr:hypothetical protein [Enterococcus hulanensis]MBO0459658.1 hypothetical protein [Enterococcus hulanensis]
MSIQLWIGIFGIVAISSMIAFAYFFIKDSRLSATIGRKGTTLLVDCGLLFVSLLSIIAGVLLYMNWQEQLKYFLNR